MQPTQQACSNFLPCDFSSERAALKLVKGASLSNEQQISYH
jgi:hypothetical protein